MTRFLAQLLGLAAVGGISFGALFARDSKAPAALPPVPNPVDAGLGGLQTSVTTGGYRFVVSDTPAKSPIAGAVVVPNTFPATASLQNRSPFEIDFTFPNAATADLKFTFRIFDSGGKLIWQSDTDLESPPSDITVALEKFQRWKRTTAIPLKPGGKALAAGIYTLEASINSDKPIGASAVFEVIAGTPPDPARTGINGLVLKADGVPVDGQPAPTESDAAGALVVINEIVSSGIPIARPPFRWSGKTDDLGQFAATTPPGHYRVTASYFAPPPNGATAALVYPPQTVEVEVVDQQLANVTIHLVPLAPPPTTQGIKGQVRIASPTAANPTGELPLSGAQVTIDQITDAAGTVPFHWQGVSGIDGGFAAVTPVGNYKVTAAIAALPPAASPLAPTIGVTINTTVTAGKFTEVALHIVPPTAKR